MRLGLRTRTTKDIDLGRDDQQATVEHLNAAAALDLGDFFTFEVRRTPALDAAAGLRAVRFTVRADLAGRRFERFPSTRVKDLVDLVLISDLAELDGDRLIRALHSTFATRASQPLPDAVPPPPSSWERPYAELAREVGIASDLDAGHGAAAELLNPILSSRAARRWDPTARGWR